MFSPIYRPQCATKAKYFSLSSYYLPDSSITVETSPIHKFNCSAELLTFISRSNIHNRQKIHCDAGTRQMVKQIHIKKHITTGYIHNRPIVLYHHYL